MPSTQLLPRLDRSSLPLYYRAAQRSRARTLSSWQWNRTYLRQHFPSDAADFHAWLNATLAGFHTRRGSRLGIIAPREGAKSTWLTLAYVLRCAVEGWEPHIVLLSDSGEMATQFLSTLRAELETNDLLAAVYPDACGAGVEWRTDRVRLKNGVLIKSLGRGSNIRGRKDRQHRPTLIVVDDCQSNRDIDSPTDRERTLSWFLQEVIPAGSDRTNFISVGSALHRDALAVRVQALPGWVGRTFRAVHSWPTRLDLWDEWERIATNLADDKRNDAADAYLAAHRADLTAGAVSFWPAFKPIEVLMRRRAEIGRRRFETEYQGVPGSPEGAEWPAEFFDWPGFYFTDWPAENDIALKLQSLDPSKGTGSKTADYQAHVSLALHRDGTLYADCDLRKETAWCARALDIAAAWHPRELVAEANNTMGLMMPEMLRLIGERPATSYRPPITEVNHTEPKLTRMRGAITGYLQRKQLRVRDTAGGRMMVGQMRDIPFAEHDDAPDTLATCIMRAQEIYHGGR